jgi:hypothetical protein
VFSIIEAPDAGWLSPRTLGGMAAGIAALAAFVLAERRQRHPLLDPRLFSSLRLAAGSLSICIQFFAFFGFTFVALQYLQGVRGYSPQPRSWPGHPRARVRDERLRRLNRPRLDRRNGVGADHAGVEPRA